MPTVASAPRRCLAATVSALAAACLAAAPARAAEQQAYAAALNYATPAVIAGQGDTLRFTNLDAAAEHDVDSDEAGRFESPLVGGGESTLVTGVETLPPGSYGFHCSLHSWMTGTLTIAAAGGPGTPPPPGGGGGGGGGPDPLTLAPRAPAEPLGDGGWPVYGRDLANSRDAREHGPSYNEALRLGPVWSHQSPDGDYTGTPVIAGGRLVIGSRGGTVVALNPRTGRVRWERDLILDANEDDRRISASAAIRGRRVFVPVNAVGRPTVVALSLRTGRRLWRRVIDRQERSDAYGSPQVWRGRVFMGTSGYYGEQVTGVEVSARGSVVAVDARTGERLWKTYTVPGGHDGGAVWSTPAIEPKRHRLYVGTGNAYHAPAAATTDSMLVLNARSGHLLRHFQATAGDVWNGAEDSLESPDADFGASPNLFTLPDGRKAVGQGQKSGLYWALDRRRMEPVWTAFTGPGSFQGGIIGSTAFDESRIYGPNTLSGQIWALERDGGSSWTSSDATPLRFGAVATANGVVYATDTGGFLTAREASTGIVLAKLPLGAPSWAGVAIAGGSVFTATGTASGSGYVVAYRPRP
ncbi:MAG: PQQ-binding-like beta-propeller repeat protein [Thermoleophilaceae bacterium]